MTSDNVPVNGRIVLAEDNADQLELTLAALEEARVLNPVDVVRDGVEVLDYLLCRGRWATRGEGNPMLILMDVNMPRISGIEALHEIRSHSGLRDIPVVMLTASQADNERFRSQGVSADEYVVKPVQPAAFFRAMESVSLGWMLSDRAA